MTKQLSKSIDLYFEYYNALLRNLNNLYKRKRFHRQFRVSIPIFRNEVRLLSLCYLDSLRISANKKNIGVFIANFSKEVQIPQLVSTGRLYSLATLLLQVTTPKTSVKPIHEHLRKYFGNAEVKKLENIVAKMRSIFPAPKQFRLLIKALKEFTWDKLNSAKTSDIILPVTKVDVEPSMLYDKFLQFLNQGPDPFFQEYKIPHRVNRNVFRPLIKKGLGRDLMIELFELFIFSEIFRRDYRNPMVHTTISLSQGREIAEGFNEPYYWFNAVRPHKTQLEIVVPDGYWINTLKQCLKSYKNYCIKNRHDPIPTDFQILR